MGSKDNQNAAKRVQYGSITIVKKAVPADGTDFDFHLAVPATGDTVAFRLDDSADGDTGSTGLPSATTYTLAPGTATISEGSLPSGWKLTGLACKGATATIDTEQRTVTVPVADGADIRCTFTNTGATYRNLSVATTAEPSYVRDYDWTITKEASADRIESATGNAAFQYDVVVDASAPRDRGFALSGAIAVGNPNEVAIGGVVLASPLPGTAAAADCAIRNGGGDAVTSPVTIPAGGGDFTYACSLPDGTAADAAGTHTVRATWDSAGYPGTDGTADGTASYDFADATPMVTDGSVTVTDSAADLSALAGGNVVAAGQAPRTFRYGVVWPGVSGRCTDYANTATYTEADGGTGSASETVALCLGADLDVTKNVVSSFDRTYLWDIDKDAAGPGTHAADPETGRVTVEYKVTVKPRTSSKDKGYRDADWAMIGTMSVRNPNTWQAVEATVADSADIGGGAACPVVSGALAPHGAVVDASPADGFQASIPAGRTVDFAYVCSFDSQPNYAGTNTATVRWDAARANTPSGTDSIGTAVTLGTWGKTPVNSTVVVTDSVHDFDPAWTVVWAEGMKPQTRTYRHTWTVDRPGTCERFKNIANVSAAGNGAGPGAVLDTEDQKITACREAPLQVATTAHATFDRTYLWDIDKSVDAAKAEAGEDGKHSFRYAVGAVPDGFRDGGWALRGTIALTNPNSYAEGAITASVADMARVGRDVECDVAGGASVAVRPGTTKVLAYACGFGAKPDYRGTNTVVVDWGRGRLESRSPVTFELDDAYDRDVEVFDDMGGGEPRLLGSASWNDAGERREFAYDLELEGAAGTCETFANTAFIRLRSPQGPGNGEPTPDPTAVRTVELCAEAPLRVEKTAEAVFDRQFLWELGKTAARDRVETAAGTPAVAEYSVEATPAGHRDSAWRISGDITVRNPNDYKDVLATVTDGAGMGASADCTVDGGGSVPVAAGAAVTLAYECVFADEPGRSGKSIATAQWRAHDGGEAASVATAGVEFQVGTETDRTVTVLDHLAERDAEVGAAKARDAGPRVLGTARWNADRTPARFDYSIELDGTGGTCTAFSNVASLRETGQTASADVHVCAEAAPDARLEVRGVLERTYLWNIDKSADAKTVMVGSGNKGAAYTVTVTPNGHADSGWALEGAVAVRNPNDYTPMAVALGVGLALDPDVEPDPARGSEAGAACEVGAGDTGTIVVAPGKTVVLPVVCDPAGEPPAGHAGTAVLAWTDALGAERETTARAGVVFSVDTERHATVTIGDDQGDPDAEARILGTADWNAEGTPTVFEYPLRVAAPVGKCLEHTNTATIVETADSASAVVRFCGAAAPLVPLEPLPSVVPAGGHLPDTGAEVRAIAWAGLALLLAGILALGAGRRRSLQT